MSHAARPRRAPQADITLRARPQHCGIGAVPFCLPAPLSLPDLHTSLCPPREGVTHRARLAGLGVLVAHLRHSIHHPLLAHSHTPTRTPSHRRACTPTVTRTRTQARAGRAERRSLAKRGARGAEARTGVVCEQVRARELDGRRPGRGAAAAGAAAAAVALVQAEVDQRRDLRRRIRGGPVVFYRVGAVRGLRRPVK